MLIVTYRLNQARATKTATFTDRAELTMWLATMSQEGQTIDVIRTERAQ